MQELADSRRKEQTLRQQLATTTTALSSSSPLLPPQQQQQQRRQTAERKQRPAQKKKNSSSSTKPPAKAAAGVGAEPRRRRRRRRQQGSGTARSRPHETAAAFVQPSWDGSPRKTLELGAPLQPLDRALVQPESSTFDGWEMFLPEVEEEAGQMKRNRGARSTAS